MGLDELFVSFDKYYPDNDYVTGLVWVPKNIDNFLTRKDILTLNLIELFKYFKNKNIESIDVFKELLQKLVNNYTIYYIVCKVIKSYPKYTYRADSKYIKKIENNSIYKFISFNKLNQILCKLEIEVTIYELKYFNICCSKSLDKLKINIADFFNSNKNKFISENKNNKPYITLGKINADFNYDSSVVKNDISNYTDYQTDLSFVRNLIGYNASISEQLYDNFSNLDLDEDDFDNSLNKLFYVMLL